MTDEERRRHALTLLLLMIAIYFFMIVPSIMLIGSGARLLLDEPTPTPVVAPVEGEVYGP